MATLNPGQAIGLLDHADTILVIVDFQDGFLRKLDPGRAAKTIDNGRFLVEVAQRLGVPSFVTVEGPATNGWTTQALRSRLGPDPVEREKVVFGLCGQSDLRQAMLDQPRRTAVLIGLETDVCILHSAVGLLEAGFRAVVVSDATAAPGDEHALGLERAGRLGVEIAHTKGVYYEWIRSLAGYADVVREGAIAPPLGSRL